MKHARKLLVSAALLVVSVVHAEESAPVAGGATSATGAVTGEGDTSTGVNASTGAPSVSYSFKLPPGRLTPSLGLKHVMRGGTLDAGYGWELNTSSIVRVKRPVKPRALSLALANGGYVLLNRPPFPFDPYNPNNGTGADSAAPDDWFEIDGEPLVPLCHINGSGGCVESFTESVTLPSWARGGILFRKQHDPEFTQYILVRAVVADRYLDLAWVERSKSGHVRIFGNPGGALPFMPAFNASEANDLYYEPTEARPSVIRWNVFAECDSNVFSGGLSSNIIQYVWSRTPNPTSNLQDDSRAYLTQVLYDTPGPSAAPSTWTHRVLLSWQSPSEYTVTDYAPAWTARPTARLKQVTISSLVTAASSKREVIRRYHLGYERPGGLGVVSRSMLANIQQEGRSGAFEPSVSETGGANPPVLPVAGPLLPPTSFAYSTQTGIVGHQLASHHTLNDRFPFPFGGGAYQFVSVLDVNRDGWPDLYRGAFGSNEAVNVHLNRGGSGTDIFFDELCASQAGFAPDIGRVLELPSRGLTLNNLQLPGRGLDAFVPLPYNQHNWCKAHLEERPAFQHTLCSTAQISGMQSPGYQWVEDECPSYQNTFLTRCMRCWEKNEEGCDEKPSCYDFDLVGDIDGDGLPDLLTRKYNWANSMPILPAIAHYSASWDGETQPLAVPVGSQLQIKQSSLTNLVDINGDGVVDLLSASSPTSSPTFGVWYGRGDGRFLCTTQQSSDGKSCQFRADDSVCIPGISGQCQPGMVLTGTEDIGDVQVCANGGAAAEGCGAWPWFRRRQLFIHDLNGDGLSDFIRIDPGDFTGNGEEHDPEDWRFEQLYYSVWFNIDGRHFERYASGTPDGRFVLQISQPGAMRDIQTRAPSGTPGYMYSDARIAFADINASGTEDLVVAYQDGVQYVDFGVGPAGLLTEVRNGYGGYTKYQYETLQRLSSGKEWATKVDRVIPVVTSKTEGVDGPEFVRRSLRTAYEYADPAYDSWKHRLVGFGMVAEKPAQGPVTVRGFNYGPCETSAGCATPGQTSDDDFGTAISGTPTYELTTNGLSLDFPFGAVLAETQTRFSVIEAPGLDGRKSWAALPVERIQHNYDVAETQAPSWQNVIVGNLRACPDCAVLATSIARVPTFMGPSTVIQRWTNEYGIYGNLIAEHEHGHVGADGTSPVDEVITIRHTIKKRPPGTDSWIFRESEQRVEGSLRGVVRRSFFNYDAAGNVIDVAGGLTGTKALARAPRIPGRFMSALPPPGASVDRPDVILAHYDYDAFGKVVLERGPAVATTSGASVSQCTRYNYVPTGAVLATSVVELVNCGSVARTTSMVNDVGFGVTLSTLAPTGERERDELDAFGRIAAHFDPHPTLRGLTEAVATTRTEYPEAADGTVDLVAKTTRYTVQPYGPESKTIEYRDGHFAAILTVAEADAGDPEPYIVSGQVERDAFGRAVHTWRPRRYSGDPYAIDLSGVPSEVPGTDSIRFGYDIFGRHVATSDGSIQVLRVDRRPLSETIWDAEDLKPAGDHAATTTTKTVDGHGREVSVVQRSADETLTTTSEYLPSGEVVSRTSTVDGVLKNRFDYEFDSLGRMVSSTEMNSKSPQGGKYIFAYNDAGLLVGTSDPGMCGENLHYDEFGRLVARDFSPCNLSLQQDIRGLQQAYTKPDLSTGTGTEVFYQYDTKDGSESAPSGGSYRGRVVAIHDRATSTTFDYDARGRLVGTQKRLSKPGWPNKDLAVRYADHVYTKRTTYDRLDRPVDTSTGADVPELLANGLGLQKSIVRTEYTRRGLVAALRSSYGLLVENTYEPDGQPKTSAYGDRARSTATRMYDTRRRVFSYHFTRNPQALWDSTSTPGYVPPTMGGGSRPTDLAHVQYTYDDVNNPIAVDDLRATNQWPAGAKPRSLDIEYDDMYRTKRVTSTFAQAPSDVYISPFDKENDDGSARPMPHRLTDWRTLQQDYNFDIFGDLRSSDDDQHLVWDRSLGAVIRDVAGGHPSQMRSAGPGQDVQTRYDLAGRLTEVVVNRSGSCSTSRGCNMRLQYVWDEVGQLSKASRWDSLKSLALSTAVVTATPTLAIAYRYGTEGRAIKEISEIGEDTVYTVDVFDSLYLKDAAFDGSDYESTAYTQQVVLPYARIVYGESTLPLSSSGEARLFFVGPDKLGSPSIVFDAKTSEVIEAREYGPFGATESDFRPARWKAFRERWHFTGKEEDSEVGLVYMGARYYSPQLGVFLSPDPLPILTGAGDLNVYAYVGGQTYRASDPTGLQQVGGHDLSSAGGAASVSQDAAASTGPDVSKSKRAFTNPRELHFQAEGGGYLRGHAPPPTAGPGDVSAKHVAQSAGNAVIKSVLAAIGPPPLPMVPGPIDSIGKVLGYQDAITTIADSIVRIDPAASDSSKTFGTVLATAAPLAAYGLQVGAEALAGRLSGSLAAEGGLAVGAGGVDIQAATVFREIRHGETVANLVSEVSELRAVTNLEYAVVSRTNGTRALVYGGSEGIDFADFPLRRILGHSHPLGYPTPSGADFQMLESLGQRSSWLLENNLIRFGVRRVP